MFTERERERERERVGKVNMVLNVRLIRDGEKGGRGYGGGGHFLK